MLSLIAAVADDRAIGKDNQLPWHLSGDLKRFKEITAGHPIIMGRKTFLSLGRVLPKRHHYVLTGDPSYSYEHDRVTVCRDASELFKQAGESEEEWFVIGGASVYEQALDMADKLYLTKVHMTVDGADAFFPVISPEDWQLLSCSELQKDCEEGPSYEYADFVRIQ